VSDAPPLVINVTVGTAGAVPTPPAAIRSTMLGYLTVTNPGYTDLPGALIEDILSTDVAAVALCDSAAIDLINSLTPNSANAWLLAKLGQLYGVPFAVNTNTSVYVVFHGTPGFVVPKGFVVGDGTYQYIVQDGGAVGVAGMDSLGDTPPLFCVATQTGSWAVAANTVTTLITSVPGSISLAVNNPNTGTPSPGPQSEADYRAQVMQAGLASAQGMGSFLKTQLFKVSGVQQRLVSVAQVDGGGWEVIVGGGDPYSVAFAIYTGLFDISTLVGSVIHVTGITNASPGVVTTDLNHGLVTGQADVHLAGVVGMTGVNGGPYTVTVIDEKTFSFGVDTTGSGSYVSGGVVTPNNRNVSVNLTDYPDTYTIPFVNPPQQTVEVQLLWNTSSPNFVSPDAVAQLGVPAITNYINSIPVGAPINLFELQEVFQVAVSSLIPIQYLTRMVFTVSINGISTPVEAGTGIIAGDPESYFLCNAAAVTITQG
jgi:hypothetical protein